MKFYMVGIKGAGMSSLAMLLKDFGNEIVGYDDNKEYYFTQKGLEEKNIPIYYDDTYELDKGTTVIYSAAFKETHRELLKAKEKDLEMYNYTEYLGTLTKQYKTIAVSGCHGKTTTTAMLSHVLNSTEGANYIIGDGTSHAEKGNELLVIEACEYRRHFLNYYPEYTIITNIELDHVDYYKNIDDVKTAYIEFANQTNNKVIIYGDHENSRNLNIQTDILYYGVNDNNDIIAKNIIESNTGMIFDVYIKGEFYKQFNIPIYGKHILQNTLAVITICYLENINKEDVEKYLRTFPGANRRFSEEKFGTNIIIDDYAHHPTEIEATINAVRQKYPNKEIVSIFEPHTYSRTKEFYKEFTEALNKTEYQYITPIFNGSRENKDEFKDITNKIIINNLTNGKEITVSTVNQLLNYENSVILFMSAGNISKYIEEYKRTKNK